MATARAAVALVVAAFFLWCAWSSLRAGASRLISDYAVRAAAPAAADAAIGLAPSDPEARYARAGLLADAGDDAAAARAYEEALHLRPRDYVIWVELGKARDQKGDAEGAIAAFTEAARLAPFYAQPRWQLGNALLRAGRREEAAAELKRAAESDPRLYPNLIQTLWHAGGRDPHALVRAVEPRTPDETLAVVRFLIKAGAAGEGLGLLRESGAQVSADARRSLVADLLAAQDFADAYEVWSGGRVSASGAMTDGGFETEARTDEEGFGWRFARGNPSLKFSLDADSPREGQRSLKVEYAGNSDTATPAVSQLAAVEPGARYRLRFAARAEGLTSGGMPLVVVSKAPGEEALAQSEALPRDTGGWREFEVEFRAPGAAVTVAIRRAGCRDAVCPIFGRAWFDDFSLRKL
jgi:hypothetical protein